MAKRRKKPGAKGGSAANLGFEAQLWQMAQGKGDATLFYGAGSL